MSEGIGNTALGTFALNTNTTGFYNTTIGYHSDILVSNLTNATAIGYNAIAGSSNEVRLGNADVTSLYCKGAYVATTPLMPNLMADANGQILRSTATLPAGSGTAGKIAYWTDAGTLGSNTNLHWDNANSRLGIGTTSPGQNLTVDGTFGILEGGASPTSHTTFQGGSQTTNITYTLPIDDGSIGEMLTSNGSGILSWSLAESPLYFSNGLDRSGNAVKLGGFLTESTSIVQSSNETFTINNTGTGKTAINLGSTGDFQIEDNGTAFFTATDAGNIGIGTSSPGQKLTVDGTFGILEGGTSPTSHTIFQGGSQTTNIAYTLPIDDGSIGEMLTTDGVGVLSWTPAESPLTFTNGLTRTSDAVTFGGALTGNTTITQNVAETLSFSNTGSGKTAVNLSGSGDFQIENSGTAFFIATDVGKIGIGTTNPGQILSVAGTIESTTGGIKFPDGTTQTTEAGNIHTIGESYGGGIVFFLYEGGRHGLIAAAFDQSTGMRWYAGTNTHTMANANGLGSGKTNTTLIIANQGYGDGDTYAARLCNEYYASGDGAVFGDWYLPSNYELIALYEQKDAVGSFANAWYWSSSEYESSAAICVNFNGGGQANYGKNFTLRVRVIRAF
jgi:hypothetical protein